MIRSRTHAIVIGLAVMAAASTPALCGRHDDYTARFKETPDQAKVLGATLLGGPGTEWLVGGGFQADGTVFVAGTSLGPEVTIAGQKAVVIGGPDHAAPPAPQPQAEMKGNQPVTGKDGKPKMRPFAWTDANATAFFVRLSADLKTVKGVSRLPWGAGGATSAAVDAEGNLYVAGPAVAEKIRALAFSKEMPAPALAETKLASRTVYVAKISPDGGKVLWVRYLTGPSEAPKVELRPDGRVTFQSVDIRVLGPDGSIVSSTVVPTGISRRNAVNPRDGTIAYGHEHHWPTGREPWRCPVLNIHKPTGELLYQLYDWGGPYVGLDNLRLVSDSAVRQVTYDADGHLVIGAWSDGGNSVMYREPTDVRTMAEKFKGLGMTAWGAGVLSCVYLIKIDTTDYKVIGGTLWMAYLRDTDKPNSIWVNTLSFAQDGSVLIGGHCAWGLIQTGNHLNTGSEPGGVYVAVLSKDMTSLRFSSVMNACGQADIADGERWAFGRGTVGGRNLVLVCTGAGEADTGYNSGKPAPIVGGVQKVFAGGHVDGHLTVLDLGK